MSFEYGSSPSGISLATYSGTGVNNGNSIALSPGGQPLLLSFVNVVSSSGKEWLKRIASAKDASFNAYVVAFNYSTGAFQTCDPDMDVKPAVNYAGGDSAFTLDFPNEL
jgi:hypothetical protein